MANRKQIVRSVKNYSKRVGRRLKLGSLAKGAEGAIGNRTTVAKSIKFSRFMGNKRYEP